MNKIQSKIQDIIDDHLKPRSIKEIKEYFNLNYPFAVKRSIKHR